MTKTAVRHLLLLAVFTAFCTSRVFSQTITIGAVDPGPYGPGSTVAIQFFVNNGTTNYVNQNNTYQLYMSDASGNFTSTTPVATLPNTAYATYINYTIPAGLPAGSGYQFKIVATSTSSGTSTSAPSTALTILSSGTAPVASASSISQISTTKPEVFGSCNGPQGIYFIQNTGAATGSTITFFNETTQTVVQTSAFIGASIFGASATNYTIIIKAANGGLVSTKAYQLINNKVNSSLPSSGSNTVCLPSGGSAALTFNVDLTSTAGIQNNYPGDTYTYTWGDGSFNHLHHRSNYC